MFDLNKFILQKF